MFTADRHAHLRAYSLLWHKWETTHLHIRYVRSPWNPWKKISPLGLRRLCNYDWVAISVSVVNQRTLKFNPTISSPTVATIEVWTSPSTRVVAIFKTSYSYDSWCGRPLSLEQTQICCGVREEWAHSCCSSVLQLFQLYEHITPGSPNRSQELELLCALTRRRMCGIKKSISLVLLHRFWFSLFIMSVTVLQVDEVLKNKSVESSYNTAMRVVSTVTSDPQQENKRQNCCLKPTGRVPTLLIDHILRFPSFFHHMWPRCGKYRGRPWTSTTYSLLIFNTII